MTRPNPPENLACRLAEDIHGTRLSWDNPSEIAPNNTIKYYNLNLELCEKIFFDTKCKKCEYQSFFIRSFTRACLVFELIDAFPSLQSKSNKSKHP